MVIRHSDFVIHSSFWFRHSDLSMSSLLIQNGTILDPSQKLSRKADLMLRNGHVAAIGTNLGKADQVIDAGGCYVTPGLIEYSFAEPPLTIWGETSPSLHFRHGSGTSRRANIAWADGHVTGQVFEWTYAINAYGAENAQYNLGFFGPRDNSLFRR